MRLSAKQRRAAVTAAVTAAVYLSLRFLLPLFLPFIAAYVIALFLRPSAAFLEKRLRFRIEGKEMGPSIGVIGGAELLLAAVLLGVLLFGGGRRLLLEANQLMAAVPLWVRGFDRWLTGLCRSAEGFCRLREGVLVDMMRGVLLETARAVQNAAMPKLVINSVGICLFIVKTLVCTVVLFIASILSLQEMDELRRRRYRSVFHREFFLLGRRLTLTGSAWLRTQAVLLLLTSGLCTLALLAIGNPYFILGGIGIGLLDALPIFGTGTVLIPWGIFLLIQRKWFRALVILGLYLACYLLREFAEAKLMGKQVGLSPLETLMAIWAGLRLFGFLGFILGPVGLLLIEDLVAEYDREQPASETISHGGEKRQPEDKKLRGEERI